MIKGVTKGFRYKMHIVKKHFPIDINITKEYLEIKRFLGERSVKTVKLLEGVSVTKNEKNNEELWFDGNDIDKVSLTCKLFLLFCLIFLFKKVLMFIKFALFMIRIRESS